MNVIFMEPVYKDYIWGGNRLKEEMGKNTPYEKTAESWEISSNENGVCVIKNEEYKGKNLNDLFNDEKIKESIFGKKCNSLKTFPILIKLIDAKDKLSVQVHPDDEYAKKIGFPNGKNEMWYVVSCGKDAQIIGGLKENVTKEQLKEIIENDEIKKYLNYINIKQGDSIYIPANTVHAILQDILVCEIQQNSDITYRIYDWDRKDKNGNSRALHKKEAIEVIDPKKAPIIVHENKEEMCQKVVECDFFNVEKIDCKDCYKDTSNIDTFYTITVIEGEGILETSSNKYQIKKGESCLIPATLGEYKIEGKIKFLKAYVV